MSWESIGSVNHRLKAAAAVLALAAMVCLAAGVANAQTTVTATAGTTVTQTVTAGQSLTAGTFAVSNTSGLAVTLSSVSINISDPNMFSSLSLTVQIGTNSSSFSITSPTSGDNAVSLSGLPTVNNGQTASFTLTANISSNPSRLEDNGVAYASLSAAPRPPRSRRAALPVAALLVSAAALLVTTRARFRSARLLLAAVVLAMALSEAGCGDQLPFGSSGGSSTLTVDAMSGTDSNGAAISVTGLPLTLGTLSL